MKKYMMLLAACCMASALALPAQAADDTFEAPEPYLFGRPTSDETIYVGTEAPVNRDRSKNAAMIPPVFGSPTSYTLNSGEMLTPNLIPGSNAWAEGMGNSGGVSVMPPTMPGIPSLPGPVGPSGNPGYTEVRQDLYYSGGYLGTLKIPAVGLTVKIYQGTDQAALRKGAGHYTGTSIWEGNVALAAHNRGVANHFGKIHQLDPGDTVKLETKLGTRVYHVESVRKILATDLSVLDASTDNIITLTTCVRNQPDYRWCVVAREA